MLHPSRYIDGSSGWSPITKNKRSCLLTEYKVSIILFYYFCSNQSDCFGWVHCSCNLLLSYVCWWDCPLGYVQKEMQLQVPKQGGRYNKSHCAAAFTSRFPTSRIQPDNLPAKNSAFTCTANSTRNSASNGASCGRASPSLPWHVGKIFQRRNYKITIEATSWQNWTIQSATKQ